jgi:hypothetical protein
MGDGLEELRAQRFAFLKELYDASEGSMRAMVPIDAIGAKLGFDRRHSQKIADYLDGEGLLRYAAAGPQLEITHWGVKEVEEALSAPEQPTEHFPPIFVTQNYLHVETMSQSQIQQGTVGSSQAQQVDVDGLGELLAELRSLAAALDLNGEQRREYKADIGSAAAQLTSPRPNVPILRESLHSIRRILEGAAGAGVAAAGPQIASALEHVGHALASLPG